MRDSDVDVRIIPSLLLRSESLVKTRQFSAPKYVGDPLNAVRTFNEKGVDELLVLDIDASSSGVGPNLGLIASIAAECFMPMAYGGGITSVNLARSILTSGVEKVVLNKAIVEAPAVVEACAKEFGTQAVVASLDFKRDFFGRYSVRSGDQFKSTDPVELARHVEALGAGELLLTSVDREGTGQGYDLELIRRVSQAVNIPVVANGGAGSLTDFRQAVDAGASALSAGSMFVFYGKHRAVLITYPERKALEDIFR